MKKKSLNNRRQPAAARPSSMPACLLVLMLLIILAQGCAPPRPAPDPEMDRRAMARALEIREFNSHINAARGQGSARLVTEKGTQTYTLAWAAAHPLKLRLTLLALGRPVETVISDGRAVCFISHTGRHAPHTIRSADPDLGDLLTVPVRLSQAVALLLGRYPLPDFNDAWFRTGPDRDPQLSLRQTEQNRLLTLSFAASERVRSIVCENRLGKPLYTIELGTPAPENGPGRHLVFTGSRNRSLTLSITRLTPVSGFKDSLFRVCP